MVGQLQKEDMLDKEKYMSRVCILRKRRNLSRIPEITAIIPTDSLIVMIRPISWSADDDWTVEHTEWVVEL